MITEKDASDEPILENILPYIVQDEGGWRVWKTPHDSGGQTFAGLAERWTCGTPAGELMWEELDANGVTDRSKELARQVYETEYWNKCAMDLFPMTWCHRYTTFDYAVNCGQRRAVKLAQIISDSPPMTVAIDGIMGVKTADAVKKVNPKAFAIEMTGGRILYYRELDNKYFENGWINRAKRVRDKSFEFDGLK